MPALLPKNNWFPLRGPRRQEPNYWMCLRWDVVLRGGSWWACRHSGRAPDVNVPFETAAAAMTAADELDQMAFA
jgi:hypothetical protein